MKAEELLKKIKRLEDIAIVSLFPSKLGTEMSEYNEDWFIRTDRYKINLINQFKKEANKDSACKFHFWYGNYNGSERVLNKAFDLFSKEKKK